MFKRRPDQTDGFSPLPSFADALRPHILTLEAACRISPLEVPRLTLNTGENATMAVVLAGWNDVPVSLEPVSMLEYITTHNQFVSVDGQKVSAAHVVYTHLTLVCKPVGLSEQLRWVYKGQKHRQYISSIVIGYPVRKK